MKFRKKTTAAMLIALFMISVFAVAIPVNAVVESVVVSVDPDPITAGETTEIEVVVTTTVNADTYTGTITVTDPDGGTSTADISGTGLATPGKRYTKVYPTDFTAGATTDIAGSYSVSAIAEAIEGTGSFVVRTPDSEATVSLTVFVEEAPVISISVYPTTIDFGSIAQGGVSGPEQVLITSASTVSIDVSASVDEVGSFYTDNLLIGSSHVVDWRWTLTDEGPSVNCGLSLGVPSGATLGLHEGTLVFWAQEAGPN